MGDIVIGGKGFPCTLTISCRFHTAPSFDNQSSVFGISMLFAKILFETDISYYLLVRRFPLLLFWTLAAIESKGAVEISVCFIEFELG